MLKKICGLPLCACICFLPDLGWPQQLQSGLSPAFLTWTAQVNLTLWITVFREGFKVGDQLACLLPDFSIFCAKQADQMFSSIPATYSSHLLHGLCEHYNFASTFHCYCWVLSSCLWLVLGGETHRTHKLGACGIAVIRYCCCSQHCYVCWSIAAVAV